MLLFQEYIVFGDNLSFQRCCSNTELFSRMTDDGPGFQEDDPILRRDVIGMDRDIVTGNLSSEDTHFSVHPFDLYALPRNTIRPVFAADNSVRQDTADFARPMYRMPDYPQF